MALVLQRVHPDDVAFVQETIARASRDGADLDFEHRFLMPDGSVKYLHVVAQAVNEARGTLEYVGAVMDVTAHTRAQQALERAFQGLQALQDQHRLVIDTIPGLVWSARPDGAVDFVNQRWLDYTGLAREEALGWGWEAAVHPDDRTRLLEARRAAVAAGTPLEIEARLRRFDGAYRWFSIRGVPLRDERGNIAKWYGTNTDIEDRKRAEDALHQAQAALAHVTRVTTLGELMASIAHEVNQPLDHRRARRTVEGLPQCWPGRDRAVHPVTAPRTAGMSGIARVAREHRTRDARHAAALRCHELIPISQVARSRS